MVSHAQVNAIYYFKLAGVFVTVLGLDMTDKCVKHVTKIHYKFIYKLVSQEAGSFRNGKISVM